MSVMITHTAPAAFVNSALIHSGFQNKSLTFWRSLTEFVVFAGIISVMKSVISEVHSRSLLQASPLSGCLVMQQRRRELQ